MNANELDCGDRFTMYEAITLCTLNIYDFCQLYFNKGEKRFFKSYKDILIYFAYFSVLFFNISNWFSIYYESLIFFSNC